MTQNTIKLHIWCKKNLGLDILYKRRPSLWLYVFALVGSFNVGALASLRISAGEVGTPLNALVTIANLVGMWYYWKEYREKYRIHQLAINKLTRDALKQLRYEKPPMFLFVNPALGDTARITTLFRKGVGDFSKEHSSCVIALIDEHKDDPSLYEALCVTITHSEAKEIILKQKETGPTLSSKFLSFLRAEEEDDREYKRLVLRKPDNKVREP